jgi:hypothetical protein
VVLASGEFARLTPGVYLGRPENPIIKDILGSLASQNADPKELEDCIEENREELDSIYIPYFEPALKTKNYYVVFHGDVDKYEGNLIKTNNDDLSLKERIMLVLQDKAATGNNYPIVVWNVFKDAENPHVILDDDIKEIYEGYYAEPLGIYADKNADEVIKKVHDIELDHVLKP